MDFVELVKNGKYKPEELSEKSRAFLEGMRYIQRRVEEYKAGCDPDEEDGVLGQMVAEIEVKAIDWLVGLLECDICEYIVCTIDDEAAELPFN